MPYWLDRMDRLPPNVCFLVARKPHAWKTPLSIQEIAQRGNFATKTVRRVARLRSWAGETIEMQERFKLACGIIPGRECVHVAYIKRTSKCGIPFFHIQRLRRKAKDKRLDKFLSELMKP